MDPATRPSANVVLWFLAQRFESRGTTPERETMIVAGPLEAGNDQKLLISGIWTSIGQRAVMCVFLYHFEIEEPLSRLNPGG